jgi:hypothetical protein
MKFGTSGRIGSAIVAILIAIDMLAQLCVANDNDAVSRARLAHLPTFVKSLVPHGRNGTGPVLLIAA